MNTFIFSYDTLNPNVTADQVHTLITQSKFISSWYFAFPGTYLLKTSAVGRTMTEVFEPALGNTAYIMSRVERLDSTGGKLPGQIWQWFNSENPPLISGS